MATSTASSRVSADLVCPPCRVVSLPPADLAAAVPRPRDPRHVHSQLNRRFPHQPALSAPAEAAPFQRSQPLPHGTTQYCINASSASACAQHPLPVTSGSSTSRQPSIPTPCSKGSMGSP
eukprot:364918-Chlamydomonas_euryale.AAC.14